MYLGAAWRARAWGLAHNSGMTDAHQPLTDALGHTASDKRLEVLRRVGLTGSISQAAREAGISYKAAWQAIDTLTSLSGWTLVDRSVGGSGGGGARLTAQGMQLLALADELALARAQVLARFALSQQGPDGQVGPLGQAVAPAAGVATGVWGAGGVGLRTSMRNQMPCTVVAVQVQDQGPMVCVVLESAGGAQLASLVTRESADLLGLVPGLPVLVLCKATAVTVEQAFEPEPDLLAPLSGPTACVLPGVVADVSDDHGPQEVALTLPGGHLWVGFVAASPPGRHPAPTLTVGDKAMARFSPSALVIGLPG